MKKSLSIFFVLTLFVINYPAFAAKRLPCSKVLSTCTSIQGLEEEEFLPSNEDDDLEAYIEGILNDYTAEELESICKSCVVAKSRDSKCINRGIKKCKKSLGATNDLLYN
jgi:hypothetical protein